MNIILGLRKAMDRFYEMRDRKRTPKVDYGKVLWSIRNDGGHGAFEIAKMADSGHSKTYNDHSGNNMSYVVLLEIVYDGFSGTVYKGDALVKFDRGIYRIVRNADLDRILEKKI